MAFYSVHDSHNYLCYYVTRYLIFRNIIWILHWSIGLSITYYDVNKFSSYKYLKLSHHKHGTETFIKKNAFLIKSFFLSKKKKILGRVGRGDCKCRIPYSAKIFQSNSKIKAYSNTWKLKEFITKVPTRRPPHYIHRYIVQEYKGSPQADENDTRWKSGSSQMNEEPWKWQLHG